MRHLRLQYRRTQRPPKTNPQFAEDIATVQLEYARGVIQAIASAVYLPVSGSSGFTVLACPRRRIPTSSTISEGCAGGNSEGGDL